jgi:hypothetical protein
MFSDDQLKVLVTGMATAIAREATWLNVLAGNNPSVPVVDEPVSSFESLPTDKYVVSCPQDSQTPTEVFYTEEIVCC